MASGRLYAGSSLNPRIIYKDDPRAKARGFKSALKGALQNAIKVWHGSYRGSGRDVPSGMLQKHFGTWASVQREYPGVYAERTRAYSIRKAKRGKTGMLDFTGTTKVMVMAHISVSGTSKRARGRMSGANRALNFLNGRASRTGRQLPDAIAELRSVNQVEAAQLAQFVDAKLQEFFQTKS